MSVIYLLPNGEGVEYMTMVVVKAKPGESMDRLIARFRKKILNSGVLLEYRERERHKTEAEKRKESKYRVAHLRELDKKWGRDK